MLIAGRPSDGAGLLACLWQGLLYTSNNQICSEQMRQSVKAVLHVSSACSALG